jgi:hypothetical protein
MDQGSRERRFSRLSWGTHGIGKRTLRTSLWAGVALFQPPSRTPTRALTIGCWSPGGKISESSRTKLIAVGPGYPQGSGGGADTGHVGFTPEEVATRTMDKLAATEEDGRRIVRLSPREPHAVPGGGVGAVPVAEPRRGTPDGSVGMEKGDGVCPICRPSCRAVHEIRHDGLLAQDRIEGSGPAAAAR